VKTSTATIQPNCRLGGWRRRTPPLLASRAAHPAPSFRLPAHGHGLQQARCLSLRINAELPCSGRPARGARGQQPGGRSPHQCPPYLWEVFGNGLAEVEGTEGVGHLPGDRVDLFHRNAGLVMAVPGSPGPRGARGLSTKFKGLVQSCLDRARITACPVLQAPNVQRSPVQLIQRGCHTISLAMDVNPV